MADNEEFEIEDGSNDRAYFTLVPNIVLNHSSATDQSLYLQMKRFAGEKRGGAYCTASEKTLMSKMQIGRDSFKKSLAYLLDRGWITFAGEKTVWTEGGPQKIKTYRVNDIWKMNVEHYKGMSETAPLKNKGVAETDKGVSETAQGVAETAPTKNYIKQIDTSVANAPRFAGEDSVEAKQKPQKQTPVYEVLNIWNAYPTWKATGKRETPKNPSALKELLPPATDRKEVTGAIIKKRSKYSQEDFEKAIKAYVLEIANRSKDDGGYYMHRFSLYEFLTHGDIFNRYVNR